MLMLMAGDLTDWRGESGSTFFYQSELPYDVTQAEYGDKGYTGYVYFIAIPRPTSRLELSVERQQ